MHWKIALENPWKASWGLASNGVCSNCCNYPFSQGENVFFLLEILLTLDINVIETRKAFFGPINVCSRSCKKQLRYNGIVCWWNVLKKLCSYFLVFYASQLYAKSLNFDHFRRILTVFDHFKSSLDNSWPFL